jgi:hypothetical protein
MQALSAEHILRAWEHGRNRHAVDKALLLLSLACSDLSPIELSNLTVGQRNTLLLDLRQKTLGPQADCFAKCPQCGAQLEFTIDRAAFYAPAHDAAPVAPINMLTVDGYQVSFRLPTSIDLATLVGCHDAEQGSQLLIARCVVRAEQAGHTVDAAELPVSVITALAQAMLDLEPQAEMELQLVCEECEHTWTALFDIVSFFWAELEVQAKRLLREVDSLACAYGWSEAEILALSATRRQFYLERVLL